MACHQEQIQTIQQLFPTHTYREIGEAIGRTYHATRRIIYEMQDCGAVTLKRPRWSADEMRILVSMVAAGKSDAEIAIRLNRSAASVIKRRRELQK